MAKDIFDLTNRVAVITGGSRGIGRSIAEAFAGRGAKVVITARKQDELDETAAAIKQQGGDVLAIASHAAREDAVNAMLQEVMDAHGRIDILVNNAATNVTLSPLKDLDPAAWDKILGLNLRAPFILSQKVVNLSMEKNGGNIINMCSVASLRADPMFGAYNVSKAGLAMLTRVLAKELGIFGIRVNGIAPAVIRTQFSRVLYETDDYRQVAEQQSALKRIGEWDEVAGAAVYLASDASSYVTGSILTVDGGTLA
jgi:NAD(P)-dependent dehydrogenase (short-subunit alcohol dehydrogenase family)